MTNLTDEQELAVRKLAQLRIQGEARLALAEEQMRIDRSIHKKVVDQEIYNCHKLGVPTSAIANKGLGTKHRNRVTGVIKAHEVAEAAAPAEFAERAEVLAELAPPMYDFGGVFEQWGLDFLPVLKGGERANVSASVVGTEAVLSAAQMEEHPEIAAWISSPEGVQRAREVLTKGG